MRRFNQFALLISLALLSSGCVVKRAVVSYKYDRAMEQCEKYGGVYGDLPITTEGVFDTSQTQPRVSAVLGRSMLFINQGLSFVEFPKDSVYLSYGNPYGKGAPYFKNESTMYEYYRVYVSEKSDPLCAAYDIYIKKNPGSFDKANLSKNQCVAVVGFDDPALLKAPYELTTKKKTIDDGIEIEWFNIEVLERSSGKSVAGLNSFTKCLTRKTSVGFAQGKECSSVSGTEKYQVTCPEGSKAFSKAHDDFPLSVFTFNRGEKQ